MSTPSSRSHSNVSVPSGLRTYEVPGTRGHDVVYGLAKGAGGEIYLSVSNEFTPGVCAFVCAFDTRSKRFRMIADMEPISGYDPVSGLMPHSKIHLSLNSGRDGRMFAATHFTAPAVGQRGFDPIEPFRGKFAGSWVVEYDPSADRVVNHGRLLPGEGCRISTLDDAHGFLYLLSYPRNHLVQYDVDGRRLRDLGRIGQENPFGIEVDDRGDVFTTDDFGRFLRYSLTRDRIEELDAWIPVAPGRSRAGNYARRMTRGVDGCFYGFGNKGGRLFRFDPRTMSLMDYGLIYGREASIHYEYPRIPPAKALVQTDPRTLYVAFGGDGISIDDLQVPNLVRFDLENRKALDLGKFIDPSGAPAWIPQFCIYSEDAGCLYFAMQHAAGSLKLWEVPLPADDRTSTVPGSSELLKEHEKKVNAVPFGASVEGTSKTPFIRGGGLSMTELGWRGESRLIPPGECAIADLVMLDGVIYGVTVGARSHLFRYAPYAQNRFLENSEVHVADLGVLGPPSPVSARLFVDPAQRRIIVRVESSEADETFEYDPALEARDCRPQYHSLPHWDLFYSRSKPFRPLQIRPDVPEPACARSADGSYTVRGNADGTVAFDSAGRSGVVALKNRWKVRAIAVAKNLRAFGFYGEDDGIGEAFELDLRTLRVTELGILQVPATPRFWMCHRCDSVLAGDHGEIYFGESDRISHLFAYHPPERD